MLWHQFMVYVLRCVPLELTLPSEEPDTISNLEIGGVEQVEVSGSLYHVASCYILSVPSRPMVRNNL